MLSTPIINNVKLWLTLFAFLFMTSFYSHLIKKIAFSQLYNASFILGIASFYPSLAILLFLLVINTINYSNFSIRILIIILLGFATFLLSIIFCLLTNIDIICLKVFKLDRFVFSQLNNLHFSKLSWLIVLIIILLFSFNGFLHGYIKKVLDLEKRLKL